MTRHSFWNLVLSGLLISTLGLVLTACGGEEEEEEDVESEEEQSVVGCGESTTLADGVRIPVEHDCDDDEIVTPAGHCEQPEIFCGEGSLYDVEAERCVSAADVACGEGTHAEDGLCRVTDPLRCGPGTVLADETCMLEEDICGPGTELGDETRCELVEDEICTQGTQFDVSSGQCVDLEAIECGENTVASNGICIPQRTFADQLAADAIIDHSDGEPIVPSSDSSFIFTGSLADGPTQSFDLVGTEGQWLEITIYPRGLPSPAFTLFGDDDFGDDAKWVRATVAGLSNAPTRTVAIPADGTYELSIETSISNLENAEDFGEESWEYVGLIEAFSAPDAGPWDLFEEPLHGDLLDATDNLVEIDVSAESDIVITPTKLGADVQSATVEVWTTPSEFSERHDVAAGRGSVIDTSDISTLYLHFDAQRFTGPSTEFTLSARGTEDLSPGDFTEEEITAEAGEVIFISHRSLDATPVTSSVFLDGQRLRTIDPVLAENQFSFNPEESNREFFYVPEDGTYLLEFQNNSSTTINGFVSTSTVANPPRYTLDEEEESSFEAHIPAENLDQGDWRFVLIDAPTTAFIDVEISVEEGEPEASIFDTDGNMVATESTFSTTNSFEFSVTSPGVYFLAIRPYVTNGIFGSPPISGGIDVEMVGDPVVSLESGERYEETFDVDTFDLLTGSISYHSGRAPDVRLLNPDDQIVFEMESIDEHLNLSEVLPGPGEFTLQVDNTGAHATLGFEANVEASTPVDIIDVDTDFSDSYDLEALDEGQAHRFVFRPNTDLLLDLTALLEGDEELALRIWDTDQREIVHQAEGDDRVDLQIPRFTPGLYIIELEGLTDISAGAQFTIDGLEVMVLEVMNEHDPVLDIGTSSTGESPISVSDCSELVDLSIGVVMPAGSSFSIDVNLRAPALEDDETIALRQSTSGNLTTVYPDETAPSESLDPLFGESANGVWWLEVVNNSSFSSAELESWTLSLTCLN